MTTPKQIFDRLYDNNNKICTRKSLWEQFKEINREWLQQKRHEYYGIIPIYQPYAEKLIDELLEELENENNNKER